MRNENSKTGEKNMKTIEMKNKRGSVELRKNENGSISIYINEQDRTTHLTMLDDVDHTSDLSVHLKNTPENNISKKTRHLNNLENTSDFDIVELNKGDRLSDRLCKVFYDKEVA